MPPPPTAAVTRGSWMSPQRHIYATQLTHWARSRQDWQMGAGYLDPESGELRHSVAFLFKVVPHAVPACLSQPAGTLRAKIKANLSAWTLAGPTQTSERHHLSATPMPTRRASTAIAHRTQSPNQAQGPGVLWDISAAHDEPTGVAEIGFVPLQQKPYRKQALSRGHPICTGGMVDRMTGYPQDPRPRQLHQEVVPPSMACSTVTPPPPHSPM
ncbi:hypothetical protein JZ751_003529, partial [Albula glossodonta]